MRTSAPARPSPPAVPPGPHARRRRQRSAGLALQQGAPAAAGILYRRDQPELLIPTLDLENSYGPANAAWTFGAWVQLASAAQFGASPLRLIGLIASLGITLTIAANTSGQTRRAYAFELGTGAAGAEAALTRMHAAIAVRNSVTGIVADPVSVTVIALNCERLHCPAQEVAASTRLATRAARSDAVTPPGANNSWAVAYPAGGYTLQTLDPARVAVNSVVPDLAETLVTSGAASLVLGSYTDVIASAAAEYLCTGITMRQDDGAGAAYAAQFDIAIGAAGSEVVQARAAVLRFQASFAAGRNTFLDPFIIHAGERVRVRCASRGSAQDYRITLQLIALT